MPSRVAWWGTKPYGLTPFSKELQMALNVGDTAPDFELMDQGMRKIRLADLRGKKVVLLFYPMDFSPVCTTEHCTFGPAIDRIAPDGNTVVYGVNCDSPFTHEAYKKQYSIPYDLLSDPTRRMVQAYGMYAGLDPFNCSKRGTVIVGPDGRITHYEEVGIGEARGVDAVAAAASA
jgi:peroxiredoxin